MLTHNLMLSLGRKALLNVVLPRNAQMLSLQDK